MLSIFFAFLALLHTILALCLPPLSRTRSHAHPPRANVRNGTLEGLHLATFNQDLFLGVPFAQPPIDNLRLRRPVSLNESWTGLKKAVSRSASCLGHAGFSNGLTMGEDCLTLDIVRPSGTRAKDKLAVFVWIYGGGFTAGGSADQRYNTSYLVSTSIEIAKPIIAVSINYRVAAWGFLASKEVADASETNIGLFDQRLALRWIRENIAAFGGDPEKVTIAGESAGAYSVGYHLVAFGGQTGGLFRGAIMQSGSALGPAIESLSNLATSYQPIYDNITATVGCDRASDSLNCLRHVPILALYNAFSPFVVTPVLDGDFFQQLPSASFTQGKVADVAILAGSNTDEGTATFFGPRGTLHTDNDVDALLSDLPGRSHLSNETVSHLMDLYPDDPRQGCPFNTGAARFEENGWQYKRGAAIIGDLAIHAGRRATTTYFTSSPRGGEGVSKPVYSYRFDQAPWNNVLELIATEEPVFATHYAEVAFVFNVDTDVSVNATNWIGPDPAFQVLARGMARAWVSFVHDLDPNVDRDRARGDRCVESQLPYWPDYALAGENMVFRVDGSYVERDTWRTEQLAYWKTLWGLLKT
ncbi:carboxylesterase [Aspergillus germanicus]